MSALRAFFERLADRWDEQQPAEYPETLQKLLSPFEGWLSNAEALLEVGSGTGALSLCLRACAPAARLVSVDLAHAMLVRARERRCGALLVQGDVHALPLLTARGHAGFDVVVCHHSFPHFADQQMALGEIARVLRPGGYLLILHSLGRERVNAIHRSVGDPIQHDLLPPSEEAVRMLRAQGFDAVYVQDTAERYVIVGRRL